jgi:hypothetical protein
LNFQWKINYSLENNHSLKVEKKIERERERERERTKEPNNKDCKYVLKIT